jgi:hypothetical protein
MGLKSIITKPVLWIVYFLPIKLLMHT